MRKKKTITLLCTAALAMSVLGGCGAAKESAAGSSSSDTGAQVVQVQSVEGSTVTAITGTLEELDMSNMPDRESMENMAPPDGDNADRPDIPDDGNTDRQGTPPERPEGGELNGSDDTRPEGESGERPNREDMEGFPGGMPDGMTQFQAGSESISFELTDTTAITVESFQGSQDGTVESITENAILEVTLDADNNAISIVVKNMPGSGGFGGRGGGRNGAPTESGTESIL